MSKVAFIIPGFFQHPSLPTFQQIGQMFENKGFELCNVNINWQEGIVKDYVEDFKTIYQQNRGQHNVVFGFSYGALIAILCAPTLKPDSLLLCSIAPYFKEDLPRIPLAEKEEIGPKRWHEIKNLSFDQSAGHITCPTIIFYGQKEQDFVKQRAQLAKEKIRHSKLITVPNCGHDITNSNYQALIKREVSLLNIN